MENSERGGLSRTACQIDFGSGRQAEIEVEPPDNLWIVAGHGIATADLWMKSVGGLFDLRVRVTRSTDGIEIVLDRGEQEAPWCPANISPRLALTVDQKTGIVFILASGNQFKNMELGRISLDS